MDALGLPESYLVRMQAMLGDEFPAFMESYQQPRSYGFRRNPLKSEKEQFEKNMPFTLSPVPWAEEGYFCHKEEQPGKHVLHAAGAYYIQEPSAMSVADTLHAVPGERICDLCAAPGGKTTQLAGKLQGRGLLVSNEIIPARARILSQNVERMGIRNCVVLNETTDQLASQFPVFFHRILVDAPCSGEGMFRKDETASGEWSSEQVGVCADRQLEILNNADQMLMPGGDLVYSTCTFAPQEDEGVMVRFLKIHPEYELVPLMCYDGMDHGRVEWVRDFGGVCGVTGSIADHTAGATGGLTDEELAAFHLERTLRLWPHRISGEGHFVAKLHKKCCPGSTGSNSREVCRLEMNSYKHVTGEKSKAVTADYESFVSTALLRELPGVLVSFGEHLYLVPEEMRELKGLKIERAGLHLGENKKNRFEPSHALALALTEEEVRQSYPMTLTQAQDYVRGMSISCQGDQNGWVLMMYEDYSLGWGKASGGMIKNHYPKGLRVMG